MIHRLKKSTLEILLKIGSSQDGTIIEQYAAEMLGDEFEALCNCQAIEHGGEAKDVIVADGDDEYVADVFRRGGKNMRFSSSEGWVDVMDDEIALYKINYVWLNRQIMDALDIRAQCVPKSVLEDNIWVLGDHRIERRRIAVIFVRNTIDATVFSSLCDYLTENHKSRNPALVLSLDCRLPTHLQLPYHNVLVRLTELLVIESDDFKINKRILAGRIGASPAQEGFADSYKVLHSGGTKFTFSNRQSEALEFMDKENRPVHQTEILSHTSSREGKKLRQLFKKKPGMHEAWNKIIKHDGRGNYWLEY